MLQIIKLTVQTTILKLIRLYQKTFSPDHGWGRSLLPHGGCKFYPSCSEYAYQAITKYGTVKGGIMSIKRISRCHPWQKGGFDQVP
ncbi:MAG: membrane protein insertion efficiency factor YidD [Patescibacteria group bacterium]